MDRKKISPCSARSSSPRAALTPATLRRLNVLFALEDRQEAARLLAAECGNNLALAERATASELDRFRYAALRLSDGDLTRLRSAIGLAKTDWRDLLMAAGFGDDAHAYRRWLPEKREPNKLK